MFGLRRPHPRHKQSLLRFLFPRAVRERYRERLLNFRLTTLPYLKHNIQSRVYRYIVERQRRRVESGRIVDIVARQGRRLWLGPQASQPSKHVKARTRSSVVRKIPLAGGGMADYGSDRPASPVDRERGFRRKKFAAMAGSLYRSGQAAVTEIKESYAQTRARGPEGEAENHGRIHIPGAFPDVAITFHNDDQMVLFPSYAKRHTKQDWNQGPADQPPVAQGSARDEDFWRQEWERNEDERAIVDVDVRGWIYSPQVGPMTRRNRMLLGLARQLSGIPAPRADQGYNPNAGISQATDQVESLREQEKIAQEAARIERIGQAEKQVANRGGYSERPQEGGDESHSIYSTRAQSPPTSPTIPARTFSSSTNELTDAELSVANANLMARVAPFMTNPMVALPITLFFYNDTKSQSRTVMTNDAGHFAVRAALEFIPTHVRVLANENLSATQEILVTEPCGVSLISDIDDTVKRSNILGGAKEIFRNTFVRDLSDLTIDGVKEWFNRMHDMGVTFPCLGKLLQARWPSPGSLHLKQYSGMLQGIFEPVAERKKSTLNRLLRDFPERKFLLVGDSGEADLEVYTELAMANPGRILAVFIRDVTTPEETGFFDHGFGLNRKKSRTFDETLSNKTSQSSLIAGGGFRERKLSAGPTMGTLIDFSGEPEEAKVDRSAALAQIRNSNAIRSTSSPDVKARKPPPPRPAKPAELRSTRSIPDLNKGSSRIGLSRESSFTNDEPPSHPPRKAVPQIREFPPSHPLSQTQNSAQRTGEGNMKIPRSAAAAQMWDKTASATSNAAGDRPPPPPPRRRGTPSQVGSPKPPLPPRRSQASNLDVDYEPLPPPTAPPPPFAATRSGSRSDGNTPSGSPSFGPQQAVNKKLELWRRRLVRAQEQLDGLGVSLYTWRRGYDVIAEAEAIVKRALSDMNRTRRGR
ncbi:hypothetical protein B0J13DRAFT_633213 [Dactylonectria estremocensis]|uniref:Phosphatidate phosphatase APP1 catalytic domain-containing protein n=1 Tax=Dactylonectria estremocensis TaxID=1079267 RepID=A0A9P9FHB8_9HYPO|nr:hypothetical protein B0J13DRAFT_633213 [Dactylonectria estremocensis]